MVVVVVVTVVRFIFSVYCAGRIKTVMRCNEQSREVILEVW